MPPHTRHETYFFFCFLLCPKLAWCSLVLAIRSQFASSGHPLTCRPAICGGGVVGSTDAHQRRCGKQHMCTGVGGGWVFSLGFDFDVLVCMLGTLSGAHVFIVAPMPPAPTPCATPFRRDRRDRMLIGALATRWYAQFPSLGLGLIHGSKGL